MLIFLSFLFFVFKYNYLIFVLLSIEFLFFSLLSYYIFFFESMLFFYFLCFGVFSSVTGLVVFFFSIKGFGLDKVMFYFKNIKFDFSFSCIKMMLLICSLLSVKFFMHW